MNEVYTSESQKNDQIARLLSKAGAGLGLYGSDLSKRSDPSNQFYEFIRERFFTEYHEAKKPIRITIRKVAITSMEFNSTG